MRDTLLRRTRRLRLAVPLCGLALLAGCITGQKAYRQGQYSLAVQQATRRLKSDPNNAKALDTLSKAYPAAQQWHLKNIELAQRSGDRFRWESVVAAYGELATMADAVRTTPAALAVFPDPPLYAEELGEARAAAAEARYQAGLELLANADRATARDAVSHFTVANQLISGYKDVAVRLEAARDLATLQVVLNPIRCASPSLDTRFFEERLQTFLNDYKPSEFVRFVSAAEARRPGTRAPDQVIDVGFADVVVENTQSKETTQTHRKENVVLGHTRTQPPQDVLGTVTADVVTFEKSIGTRAQLDLRITEARTGKVLVRQAIPGQCVWRDTWATYRGDERAVPAEFADAVKKQPAPVPSRQELFETVAAQLFTELSNRLRNHYQRY